jgi:twitching motility protein PilT
MSDINNKSKESYLELIKSLNESAQVKETSQSSSSAPADGSVTLNNILITARENQATDIHLSPNTPLTLRKNGRLVPLTKYVFDAKQVERMISHDLPANIIESFRATGDAEYVHEIRGHGRFRTTLMFQRHGWELTARVIAQNIPTFESTGMPLSCAKLTKWAQGMILVSGPAGCGKTTTLAVLIEMINQSRPDHIVTIEEPIEIVYAAKKCQVTQREIGIHTESQHHALRAALREDPDIIVVSELRDLESIQLAVSAAETGHLVLGTMNTVNAVQTISLLIDSYPAEEQSIMRNMISESLRGIICQQLIPKKDGSGVVAAYEVLVVTPSVSNRIRKGEFGQITNDIALGKTFGMTLMENSLATLVHNDTISLEDAKDHAPNIVTFQQLMN